VARERLDRFAIARELRELGALLRLKGGNRFRARAYEGGARALEELEPDLGTLVTEARLEEIEGIGPALARVVTELYERGTCRLLEELRAEMPRGVLELAAVPGLSVARARRLQETLGIDSIDALRAACEAGRLREVAGFGPRSEARLLEAIERLEARAAETLLVHARGPALRLLDHVRASPGTIRAEVAGGVRRWTETVREIVLVVASEDVDAVLEHVRRYPPVVAFSLKDGVARGRLAGGLPFDLHVVARAAFGPTLVRATGSAAHVGRLEALGLARTTGSEDDVYRALGLPPIPPELREGAGEVEAALAGDRFEDLVALGDVRGMVHCHTDASDGRATVEEMARAARGLGMELITITDHSPQAAYAGGLTEDRLLRQWDEIARVEERVGIRILRGTEADILRDGSLDWPDRILERLEVVIASVHQRWKLGRDETTRRLVRAIEHPFFKIWGHPLGRLVARRPPIDCDMEAVLDAAARSPVALEVNGDPYRLDLEPRWIRAARARRIPFVVSTDAHSTRGLETLPFAVALARRGGLRRRDVLNTLDAASFARAVRPHAPVAGASGR
jgi:DNA polymerase (family 10)